MGFAGAGSSDQDEVVCFFGKLARAERFDLGLGDGRGAIVKSGEVLVVGNFAILI